jgi:hypothetical protein
VCSPIPFVLIVDARVFCLNIPAFIIQKAYQLPQKCVKHERETNWTFKLRNTKQGLSPQSNKPCCRNAKSGDTIVYS